MTFVRLSPKTTENLPAGLSPAAFAAAIGDQSTGGANGYGSTARFAVAADGTPTWTSIAFGQMQTLDDIGAPNLPIIGVGSMTYGSYSNSDIYNPQWAACNVYDRTSPKEYSYDYWTSGSTIQPEPSSGDYFVSAQGCSLSRQYKVYMDPTDPLYGVNNKYHKTYAWTRELFAKLNWAAYSGCYGSGSVTTDNTWYYYHLVVELADVPPVATALTPASGGTISTAKPTVGLTVTKPVSSQKFKGQWQFATDSGFTQDVIFVTESDSDLKTATAATTEILTDATRLTKEGVWYFRGRTVDEFGQGGAWTSPNTLTLDVAVPNAPNTIVPTTGSSITTDIPELQATLPLAPDSQLIKVQWQFATDSGFTTNLKSVTEPDTALRISGASSYIVPNADQLFQAVWYIRARAVDQYGQYSAYSAANSFTVVHLPSTSTPSPTGSVSVAYAATTDFRWLFADTSPVDTQTAYQVIVERNDIGALVVDSGKLASSVPLASLAIPANLKDIQLRWKVKVWDSDDVTAGYSSYNLFKVADVPVLTITSPVNASTVTSGRPAVTWTFIGAGGRTQASYQVKYTKVGNTIPTLDTNTVAGAALSYAPLIVIIRNNETYSIQVTVVDSTGLTSTQSITVTASYIVPAIVTFAVDSAGYQELGYVKITWQNIYDSSFLRWRVYRRLLGVTAWSIIGEVTLNNVNEFLDWQAPANSTFEYMVVQIVDRFGEEVESQSSASGISITIQGGDYWLIDPIDSVNNCKLFLVKDDGYTDMYEMSEYTIVGRGRHVDYGESIGKSGSLSAQIRDTAGSTARVKKQAIEALKRKRKPVILRNPFGDVYNVSLGDIAISRIAGTGTSEYCDITVPYLEIF